jgi:hypothetical protein
MKYPVVTAHIRNEAISVNSLTKYNASINAAAKSAKWRGASK